VLLDATDVFDFATHWRCLLVLSILSFNRADRDFVGEAPVGDGVPCADAIDDMVSAVVLITVWGAHERGTVHHVCMMRNAGDV
jgi:hypothetical protein